MNGHAEGKVWSSKSDVDGIIKLMNGWPSVGHLFMHRLLEDHPDITVITDYASGREWTGRELGEGVLNVACALIDLYNFEPGDHVCISFNNTDKSAILALATIVAGGFASASYIKDPYDDLLHLARLSRPKFLFCHEKNLDWARNLQRDLSYEVFGVAIDSEEFDRLLNYERAKSSAVLKLPVACRDKRRDLTALTMSSGSTGRPKPVPTSHWTCLYELLQPKQYTSDGRAISLGVVASLNHASGRVSLFSSINSGFNAVIMDDFQPATYLGALQKYKFNSIMLGAASFYQLMTYPQLDEYDLTSVSRIQPFGTKITYMEELRQFVRERPHIKSARQGYGASEISIISLADHPDVNQFLENPTACGYLVPGCQVKLVEPDSGRALSRAFERGLLLGKNETMFNGYYDVSQPGKFVRDESVFDAAGFYISGDICYFDDDEQLHFVGRLKETIVCRTVSKHQPHQFEEVIAQHPAVQMACVLGVASKREASIQCPRAYVVIKPGYSRASQPAEQLKTLADVSADGEPLSFKGASRLCASLPDTTRRMLAKEILHFANGRLSWIKQLRGGICLLDDIPTTRAIGKLDKLFLRRLTLDQVEIYGDLSE